MLIKRYNHSGLKCGNCGNHLHSAHRLCGNIYGFNCTVCRDITSNTIPVDIDELYKDEPDHFRYYVPDDKPFEDVYHRKHLRKGLRSVPKFLIRMMMLLHLPGYIAVSLFSEVSLKDWWKMFTMEIK